MKNSRILTASLAAVSLLTVSACVTDPNTGERKVSRTVLGGAGGAVAGGLLGGLGTGTSALDLGLMVAVVAVVAIVRCRVAPARAKRLYGFGDLPDRPVVVGAPIIVGHARVPLEFLL